MNANNRQEVDPVLKAALAPIGDESARSSGNRCTKKASQCFFRNIVMLFRKHARLFPKTRACFFLFIIH